MGLFPLAETTVNRLKTMFTNVFEKGILPL